MCSSDLCSCHLLAVAVQFILIITSDRKTDENAKVETGERDEFVSVQCIKCQQRTGDPGHWILSELSRVDEKIHYSQGPKRHKLDKRARKLEVPEGKGRQTGPDSLDFKPDEERWVDGSVYIRSIKICLLCTLHYTRTRRRKFANIRFFNHVTSSIYP